MAIERVAHPAVRSRVFSPGRTGELADWLWKRSPTDRRSQPQRPDGPQPGPRVRMVQHKGVRARPHGNIWEFRPQHSLRAWLSQRGFCRGEILPDNRKGKAAI